MIFVVAVALSLLGLAFGPVLVAIGGRSRVAVAALDGLTLAVVPALVLTQLAPHLYDEIGVAAPLLMLGGYAAFWLVERYRGHDHDVGTAVVVPALAIHSVFDGAALALAFADATNGAASAVLGFSLVAHRLPEGLFVGTALVPRFGLRRTFKRVALLAVGTVLGALGGHELVAWSPSVALTR
jgi:hypothetical protein